VFHNLVGAFRRKADYNYATKRMERVCNETYITSAQVVELLEKLAGTYVKAIHVILDNVPYQRCQFVKDSALRLGITLHYLPIYSPNLNLIERVWKLIKSKVLNSAYFETFDGFRKNIECCVDGLHTALAADMATLITPKFHIIDTKCIISSERLAG